MGSRSVIRISGGFPSRVLIAALRLADLPLRLTRYRGSTRFLESLVPWIDPARRCVLRLGPDSLMEVRLNDLRWVHLLFPGYRYEMSVRHCLRLFEDREYLLIDGGASVGYWSVLASESTRHRVIAVEPVDSTFAELRRNSQLNSYRFECVRAALLDGSGDVARVAVHSQRHGSSYVMTAASQLESDRFVQKTPVVTVDELVSEYDPTGRRPLILKLDVEGSEVAALEGSREALRSAPLVIYEDHGRDRDDTVSRFILTELGLRCYSIDERGRILSMRSLEDVRSVKSDEKTGFNFFATAGGSMFDRIFSAHADK